MGRSIFSRGSLFHILRSRLCRGEIVHKDNVFPGLHPPIISAELFEAVAEKLGRDHAQKRDRPTRAGASALTGLIFDASGEPMSPSFGYGRHGGRYRYYISMALQVGKAMPANNCCRSRAPKTPSAWSCRSASSFAAAGPGSTAPKTQGLSVQVRDSGTA